MEYAGSKYDSIKNTFDWIKNKYPYSIKNCKIRFKPILNFILNDEQDYNDIYVTVKEDIIEKLEKNQNIKYKNFKEMYKYSYSLEISTNLSFTIIC